MMEIYNFKTRYGTLKFKAADMMLVHQSEIEWSRNNPKPVPPKVKQEMTGIEEARMYVIAFEKYETPFNFLPTEKKIEIMEELEDSLPLVDDISDKQYQTDLRNWQYERGKNRFNSIVGSSVIENQNVLLMLIMRKKSLSRSLYKAIERISVVTGELIFEYVELLDRYYQGQKFLDVLAKRKKTERGSSFDTWDVKAHEMFIQHNIDVHGKSIHEKCLIAARIFTMRYILEWTREDNKPPPIDLKKLRSGINGRR